MASIGSFIGQQISGDQAIHFMHMRMLDEVSEVLKIDDRANVFISLALHDLEALFELTSELGIHSDRSVAHLASMYWSCFQSQKIKRLPEYIESLCLDILTERVPAEAVTLMVPRKMKARRKG